MSDKATLKTKFQTDDCPSQSDFADLIDSNFNLAEANTLTLTKNVGFTLVSVNITGSSHTQDLRDGNIFYYDITSGSGDFTFDYSNAVVGVYYFIFRRAANLAIRNITWASSKYASSAAALPILTPPTVSVDGKDLVMGFYNGSRMVLVQQAGLIDN